ncbi:MAG TPA: ABC transporter permease [Burkholderiales bacterium]|nr:ABC transporter permease [Burkholderiales bacterium]
MTPSRSLPQLAELFLLLVRRELKARYKNRYLLGYVWALATTFALAFVFWIAFKIVMRFEMENYSVYLLTGMFPWAWLSGAITGGARSFLLNAPLVREIELPRAVLPLASVAQEMAHFVLALPALAAWVVLAGGYEASPAWLWQIPFLLALQAAFVYPLALACALVNAWVRDLEQLLGIGLLLLFFATPMVYPVALVPEPLRPYFELNPLHALMQSWRSVLIHGTLEAGDVAYAAGFAAAAAALAWLLYRRLAPRIGEVA